MADGTIADEQNEKYEKLREDGLSKEEAANKAAPPDSTENRAEEAEAAEDEA